MANLVRNELIVTGPQRFDIINKIADIGLEAYVPRPNYLEDYDLIEWSYDNWGTKWDRYDEDIVVDKNSMLFTTANGPADEFVKALHKLFPDHKISLTWITEDDNFETCYCIWAGKGNILYGEIDIEDTHLDIPFLTI